MSVSDRRKTRVVVIGGGYSGSMAANRLRLSKDVEITVVNPRPEFVERTRLHQVATGTRQVTHDYGKLLGNDISLVVDTAERIDTRARVVQLASGTALEYDYLIYAAGSTSMVPPAVPGAAEFAHTVGELEGAERLRDALANLPREAPITVIGGGFTGIETAAELAEQGHTVRLVSRGALAPAFSGKARHEAAARLVELGVSVLENVNVAEVRADAVVLDDGAELSGPVSIWTTGFGVSSLARNSGLSTDALGRLLTDETLTSIDDDRVIAAGDAAAPSGQPLRMGCQSAIPLGAIAAHTVLSRIAGERPDEIDVGSFGVCVSLGKRTAIFQRHQRDDTPHGRVVAGRIVSPIKQFGLNGIVLAIRLEGRRPGYARWPKGGRQVAAMVPELA